MVGAFFSLVPTAITMDVGETRLYSENGAPRYVSGYQIRDMSKQIDVFWMKDIALEDTPSDEPVIHTEAVVIQSDEYLDFSYWLNTGSTLDIKFTARGESSIDFYLFEGDAAFNQWINSWNQGTTSWGYESYLQSSNEHESQMSYTVDGSETYYLALVNGYKSKAIVDFTFTIAKTHYQFDENSKPVCGPGAVSSAVNTGKCQIDVNLFETRQLLLRSPPLANADSHSGSKSANANIGSGKSTDSKSENVVHAVERSTGSSQLVAHTGPEITYQLEIFWSVRVLGYVLLYMQVLVFVILLAYALSWYTGTNWGNFLLKQNISDTLPTSSNFETAGYTPIESISEHGDGLELANNSNSITQTVAVEAMPMAEVVSCDDHMPIEGQNVTPSAPPSEK